MTFPQFAAIREICGRQVVFWMEDDNDDYEVGYHLTGMFQVDGAMVRVKLGFEDEEAQKEAFQKTIAGETDAVWIAQIKKCDEFGEEHLEIDPEMN